MSRIYFVRHGQAGTRHSYDALSPLGKHQARLAGEHFARDGVRFAKAYSGGLTRQLQTAAGVLSAYADAGLAPPALITDEAWNEFDLDRIYRELAPVLCEEDAAFRHEFETMQTELRAAREDDEADVHRRWTLADLKIVQAWIKGHPLYRGETWLQFRQRITSRHHLIANPDDQNIVVFTSATPIGIWAALGLDIEDHRAMRLAGVLHNASITVVRVKENQIRLHMFNAVPHLTPELCTYR